MIGARSILRLVGVAGVAPARTVLLNQGGPLAPKASASTSSATPRPIAAGSVCLLGRGMPVPLPQPQSSGAPLANWEQTSRRARNFVKAAASFHLFRIGNVRSVRFRDHSNRRDVLSTVVSDGMRLDEIVQIARTVPDRVARQCYIARPAFAAAPTCQCARSEPKNASRLTFRNQHTFLAHCPPLMRWQCATPRSTYSDQYPHTR
jgi:hypothetical protein